MKSGFVFDRAPFASAHASTLAETADGLVAAGSPAPTKAIPRSASGSHARRPAAGRNRSRWRAASAGTAPARHAGIRFCTRHGRGRSCCSTKSAPAPAAGGACSPARSMAARAGQCPSGCRAASSVRSRTSRWSSPTARCSPSSTEHRGWRSHLELTPDQGVSWERLPALKAPWGFGAIQPCILAYPDGRMQLLCRTRHGMIAEAWSIDGWRRWSRLRAIDLPNPDSGIDGLVLEDGRALLVYNHAPPRARTPLNLALSEDGRRWQAARSSKAARANIPTRPRSRAAMAASTSPTPGTGGGFATSP
jgi:hypothetical protein